MKSVTTTSKPADTVHAEDIDIEDNGLKQDANAVLATDTKFASFTRAQAIKVFWWPALLCLMATFGVINDGYQNQLPGTLITTNQGFINQFGTVTDDDGTVSLSASWVSLWGSMMPVGQIGGSIISGWWNDKFGRLGGMYFFTICYITATIIEMLATTPSQWAGAKFVFGFGQGLTVATVPVYVGELAPPQIRGTLLCLYGFLFAVGQLLANVVLYVIENVKPLDWRAAVYTEWAFHGAWILFGLVWLPESPWHYVRKGQDNRALKALNRVYKGVENFDPNHELRVIQHEIEKNRAIEVEGGGIFNLEAWKSLFRGTNTIRTWGAALAVATQIVSGSVVVFNYSAYFVQQAGIGEPFLASMIVTAVLLIGLIISFFAIEIFGRRTLMIAGGIGCTVCNIIIGVTGTLEQTAMVNNAALAFIFIWVLSYAISFASVSWVMVSECATPYLKSKTAAFATLIYDFALLVFTVSVPFMLASSGPGAQDWGTKTLLMFAITNAAALVGNYFLCPETKGRTQGEVDEMYESRIPPRKSAKFVSQLEFAGGKGKKKSQLI